MNAKREPNFLVVNKGKGLVNFHVFVRYVSLDITIFIETPIATIEETFKNFLKRDDIAIILINQNVR